MLALVCVFFTFALRGGCGASPQSQWVVVLESNVSPQTFAKGHHLRYDGIMESISSKEKVFHKFSETQTRQRVNSVRSLPNVAWAEKQEPRLQYKRANDPLYPEQWHLHTHAMSVDADFAPNVTGKGVLIAIVDDGLQHTHPEFAVAYDAYNSHDFNDNTDDPRPRDSRDGHGTSAAGVAVARAHNGHCGRGVAHGAKVAGLRLIAAPVTDATEAEALTYNAIGSVDIFSCSWGPADNGIVMGRMGYLTRIALARYVGNKRGRLGKGSIYVWAAGNGRHQEDSCAYDGYASSPYVFPVGAVDHTGERAYYSEGCANLVGVAPSSGASRGITTADLMGGAGYAPSECTSTFGGTSSAAPLAAGVFACLLEERPDLTWRDLMHVIAKGATLIKPTDQDWHYNTKGYHHSHKYGFGLLKLPPLLAAARAHVLVPPVQKVVSLPEQQFSGATGVLPFNHTWHVAGHNVSFIEQVFVRMSVLHPLRGSVRMKLTSPSRTVSILAPSRKHDNMADFPRDWVVSTRHHFGETRVNGDWTISAEDVRSPTSHLGTVTFLSVTILGF